MGEDGHPTDLMLRLLCVTATAAEVSLDLGLRDAVLPAIAVAEGVVEAWAGRRRSSEQDERCLAVISFGAGLTALLGEPPTFRRIAPSLPDGEPVEILRLPVRVAVKGDSGDPAVLRVLYGTTVPGALERYLELAEAGARDDAVSHHGPLWLYIATAVPDRFVTVSAWSRWEDIEASTGSDARDPGATRHAHLLATTEVAHYEILGGGVASPTAR
jgi:hypothetical protein